MAYHWYALVVKYTNQVQYFMKCDREYSKFWVRKVFLRNFNDRRRDLFIHGGRELSFIIKLNAIQPISSPRIQIEKNGCQVLNLFVSKIADRLSWIICRAYLFFRKCKCILDRAILRIHILTRDPWTMDPWIKWFWDWHAKAFFHSNDS